MSSLIPLFRVRILARQNIHILFQFFSARRDGLQTIHDEVDESRRLSPGDVAPCVHRRPLHHDIPPAQEP